MKASGCTHLSYNGIFFEVEAGHEGGGERGGGLTGDGGRAGGGPRQQQDIKTVQVKRKPVL